MHSSGVTIIGRLAHVAMVIRVNSSAPDLPAHKFNSRLAITSLEFIFDYVPDTVRSLMENDLSVSLAPLHLLHP